MVRANLMLALDLGNEAREDALKKWFERSSGCFRAVSSL